MRSWVTGVLVGVAVGVVGMLAVWRPWSQERAPQWLFTYAAESATFADGDEGSYMVDLAGADGQFLAFTDRPDRDVSTVDVGTMIDLWPSLFAESAPNAVLVEPDAANGADSIVMEITGVERTPEGVRFAMQVLADQTDSGDLFIGRGVRDQVPDQAQEVRLFIDAGAVRATCFDGPFPECML